MSGRLRGLVPMQASVEVEITATAWTPHGDMSFEQWEQAGRELMQMGRAWQWWVGDWVLHGERNFGDMYTEAIDRTGYEYQTLANIISVCRVFESSRRREELTWTHHVEVAGLKPAEQDRWLQTAAAEHMTTTRLRSALREVRQPTPPIEHEPKGVYVGEVSFTYAADDQADAETRLGELIARLERQGVSVTYKRTQPRHR